jgi:hypothetical protein
MHIGSPPVRQSSFNKPSPQTEQNKFLSEIQKAAETRAFRRQNSAPETTQPPPINAIDNNVKENLIYTADQPVSYKASPKEELQSSPVKQAPPPVALKPNRSSSSSFERQNSVTSESSMSVQSSVSSNDQNGAMRRLSSLIQHDKHSYLILTSQNFDVQMMMKMIYLASMQQVEVLV